MSRCFIILGFGGNFQKLKININFNKIVNILMQFQYVFVSYLMDTSIFNYVLNWSKTTTWAFECIMLPNIYIETPDPHWATKSFTKKNKRFLDQIDSPLIYLIISVTFTPLKLNMESSRSLEHVLSMQGGEDEVSYAKNCYGPAVALALSKPMLTSAIHSIKLIKGCSSSHLKIADLGCAVGDNTFSTVDTVVEVLRQKLALIDGGIEPELDLEVFFSDLPSNDFNMLFRLLDEKMKGSSRKYFAAGVPGSFYKRLFPKEELHVVVTMSALQWLSQVYWLIQHLLN